MGLNTVTTYVFWNLDEPKPGAYDFTGSLDVAFFIRTAGTMSSSAPVPTSARNGASEVCQPGSSPIPTSSCGAATKNSSGRQAA